MKKRSILVIIALVLLLIITGCDYEKKDKTSDALKFKNEYESINGDKVGNTEYRVRNLTIPEDNPMVYADANDIITMMDNNDTFVVYFGFSSCPWCRSVLPTLLEVADELDIKKIYYVDVKDIRDQMKVDDNGKVVLEKEGSEGYIGLLNRLDNVLEDYTLDVDGKEISTGKKRIYAPNVVSIVNGEAKELETGISDKQDDPFMELSDEIKSETYNKFKCSTGIIVL